MHSQTDSFTKRRKVRKGTHSCWNCKKRKVKCIFSHPEDSICITCRRRGTKCVSQEVFEGSDIGDSPTQQSAVGLTSDPICQLQTPDLSPASRPTATITYQPNRHQNITTALIESLPSEQDLDVLVQSLSGIHLTFYHATSQCFPAEAKARVVEVNSKALRSPDNHPVLLARRILLLVVGLQHCSSLGSIPGLEQHPQHIIKKLAESAIDLVTTNDLLLGTVEAVDAILLESCYHANSGNLRRSWIAMRRAVVAVQLLGLHQPHQMNGKTLREERNIDADVMWPCMTTMERLISMLTGLPTSIPAAEGARTDLSQQNAIARTMTAKIIERNELMKFDSSPERTCNLDEELIHLGEQLPGKFWRPTCFAGMRTYSEEASAEIQRTWDHVCYQTLIIQLHLPHMLHSSDDAQSSYSRSACVNASREVLTRRTALRTFNPIHPCCSMSDFMALVAALTLTLAHITSHSQGSPHYTLAHQRAADRATVERFIQAVTSLAALQEDGLAAKCASSLKALLKIEKAAFRNRNIHIERLPSTLGSGTSMHDALILNVPHGGLVRLCRHGSVVPMPYQDAQDQFAVGGLGTIEILASSDPNPIDVGESHTSSIHSQEPSLAALPESSGTMLAPQEVPNDWLFDGFDTAFFDAFAPRNVELQQTQASLGTWAVSGGLSLM